jgi:hypothetical protein
MCVLVCILNSTKKVYSLLVYQLEKHRIFQLSHFEDFQMLNSEQSINGLSQKIEMDTTGLFIELMLTRT